MLKAELQARLGDMCVAYAWGEDAGIALAAPGKLLSTATPSKRIPQGFWGLLPHEVAQYCATSSQDTPRISRLAVACELLLCALDFFDELEDNDSSETRTALGDGRLLNCTTALYQEALQILAELDEDADRSSVSCSSLDGVSPVQNSAGPCPGSTWTCFPSSDPGMALPQRSALTLLRRSPVHSAGWFAA